LQQYLFTDNVFAGVRVGQPVSKPKWSNDPINSDGQNQVMAYIFFSQLRSTLIHYRTWKLPSMPTLHFHQATHKLNGWIRASPSLTQISVINLLQLHSGFYSCAEWTWINRKCAITPCPVRLAPPCKRGDTDKQWAYFFLQSMV